MTNKWRIEFEGGGVRTVESFALAVETDGSLWNMNERGNGVMLYTADDPWVSVTFSKPASRSTETE